MASKSIRRLIATYRQAGVLVDSNLLLVYLVGIWDPRLVASFKRTHSYSTDDFGLLKRFLHRFARITTTPNILTEVAGLANQLHQRNKAAFASVFREQIAIMEEKYLASDTASKHEGFPRWGLTDTVILALARQRLLVLTDDFRLCGYLESQNIDSINFNHLRFDPG